MDINIGDKVRVKRLKRLGIVDSIDENGMYIISLIHVRWDGYGWLTTSLPTALPSNSLEKIVKGGK